MCPKHSWQLEATQNLFFDMLLLHTPSKTEIIGGLGRADITSFSACPTRRTVQPTAVHLGTAFLVLLFPLLQRRMSVFIRERLKCKMERGFSNIDKQSLNALRNMNHVSDVFEATQPTFRPACSTSFQMRQKPTGNYLTWQGPAHFRTAQNPVGVVQPAHCLLS